MTPPQERPPNHHELAQAALTSEAEASDRGAYDRAAVFRQRAQVHATLSVAEALAALEHAVWERTVPR